MTRHAPATTYEDRERIAAEREYNARCMVKLYPTTTIEQWVAWYNDKSDTRPVQYGTPAQQEMA